MDSRSDDRIALLQALAVTAELSGTELSEAAARIMADDLGQYPHAQVMVALTRCPRGYEAASRSPLSLSG